MKKPFVNFATWDWSVFKLCSIVAAILDICGQHKKDMNFIKDHTGKISVKYRYK